MAPQNPPEQEAIQTARLELLSSRSLLPSGSGIWHLIERDSRADVGVASFQGMPDTGEFEIAYEVWPGSRRHGYATEAAVALVGWLLEQPAVKSVVAICDRDNVASHRVLASAGLARCGLQADGRVRFAKCKALHRMIVS